MASLRERARRWWAGVAGATALGAVVAVAGGGSPRLAAADDKAPAVKPEDVRVGPPPELAALRKAVEDAGKKGENVDDIRRQLDALETALAGKPWARPKVQPDPVEPAPRANPLPLQPLPPLPAGDDDALARLRQIQEMQQKALEAQLRQLDGINFNPALPGRLVIGPIGGAVRNDGRLGVSVEPVSPALAAQLDLPKEQGVVVTGVRPGSAADKSGVFPNDIIVEFNGKAVADQRELVRLVDGVNAGEATDVTVIRKGKKEVVKGVVLPDRPAAVVRPAAPRVVRGGVNGGRNSAVQLSVTDDSFSLRATEDGVRYTIDGTMADGTATPTAITVKDGDKPTVAATAVDKLPAEYKDKVEKLLGSVRVGGNRRDRVRD